VNQPSRTDKRLVTIPFGISALDGEKKIIISNDRGVPVTASTLYNLLCLDPSSINTTGLYLESLNNPSIQIYSVQEDDEEKFLKNENSIIYPLI
ncbi:MAG: hypothetical protein KC506_03625, partial [Nanoarchaeota archaeon]|nr:hypothetical protein [Nanoarchaeota archaeon]